MHGINTIIGKVVAFPSAKKAVSKNSRIVTFFNASHYWGGQLEEIASSKGPISKTPSYLVLLFLLDSTLWPCDACEGAVSSSQ